MRWNSALFSIFYYFGGGIEIHLSFSLTFSFFTQGHEPYMTLVITKKSKSKSETEVKNCDFRYDSALWIWEGLWESLFAFVVRRQFVCVHGSGCGYANARYRSGFPLRAPVFVSCSLVPASLCAGKEEQNHCIDRFTYPAAYRIVSSLFSPANQYLFVPISVHWQITQFKCCFVLLSVKLKVWLRLFLIWHFAFTRSLFTVGPHLGVFICIKLIRLSLTTVSDPILGLNVRLLPLSAVLEVDQCLPGCTPAWWIYGFRPLTSALVISFTGPAHQYLFITFNILFFWCGHLPRPPCFHGQHQTSLDTTVWRGRQPSAASHFLYCLRWFRFRESLLFTHRFVPLGLSVWNVTLPVEYF